MSGRGKDKLRLYRLSVHPLRSVLPGGIGEYIRPLWFRSVLPLPAACALLAAVLHIAPASVIAAGQQGQASGGEMTNAGPQAAIFDSQHRPITAGGFVKTGPLVFIDATEKAGLSKWRNVTGAPEKRVIIEAKGSGVCLLDYDNDGWLDIYLVNGSTPDALAGKAPSPHAALFHNNHDGTFTDGLD